MAYSRTHRRTFLKAAGISVALPLLESISRAEAPAAVTPCLTRAATRTGDGESPVRMVCVGNEFGMYPGAFWPEQAGSDYELSPLLEPLEPHRQDFTLFSHLDHGLKGGHFAVHTFLTGVNAADARGMADGGISIDQRAAEHVGSQTRFPSLTIGSADGLHGGCQMSWTRTGTRVPPVPGPRELFRMLYVDDSPDARRQAQARIELRTSILDAVLGDAKALERRISSADRQKLQQYFTSVRDVESKLTLDRHWQDIARPRPPIDEPENLGLTRDLPTIYDLLVLALQTDSTRIATLEIGGSFAASDLGIRKGYHALSHHGQDPENIRTLVEIEQYQVQEFARFIDKLKSVREPHSDGTLLDSTMVLFGSGMGNANSHTNSDLPIVLAGGGFRHGEHKRLPATGRRIPLCNLYVSMLQRFGVETESFSVSNGTLAGLESV